VGNTAKKVAGRGCCFVTRNPKLRHAVPQLGSAFDPAGAVLCRIGLIIASVEPDVKQGGDDRQARGCKTGES